MTEPDDTLTLAHLAQIVKWSDDAIVSKDLDGIILSWNRAAERLFGYTSDEAIGKSIRMIIPPDRQSEEDVVLSRIRAGHDVSHFETVRQRRDGRLVPISLTVSPIRNSEGTVIGASKIARDITEHARLQAVLQEQTALAEQLGQIGAALTASLDPQTIVQRVTDAGTSLTGAELGAFFFNAELPQPKANAISAPTFAGEGPVRLDDVTADPRYGQSPPFHDLPAGQLPVRSYLAVPVKNTSGQVLGGLFFGHSQVGRFTDQHEKLAMGIAGWASLALENARLYTTATEADRLKDEFLAVLSHELRTPLNAIVGYARLLRGGLLDGEKAARGLETLERNANALTQIVEDVLDVSRIVSGKIRLDVQPVELPLVVHNAIATVQPAADAKGVRLQSVVDPRVSAVSGDPNRLQQVVWNLLSNAVKFTPRGGMVQARLERVDSHVEIVVSDTGIGIDADFLPHVFERFRQADAGPTRKSGGLGLGLSIVRHIVELHGGIVQAVSPGAGLGSTFVVRLPLMIVHRPEAPEPRVHPRTEQPAALAALGNLQGVHVVAIDDEEDALHLLRVVLETSGARVTTFRSGGQLLALGGTIRPDALVIDLGMPDMDGFTLIERIRTGADGTLRDVPAVALTAFARSEDRTRALNAGFEMHLAKPVDPGELVASVKGLIRRSRRARDD